MLKENNLFTESQPMWGAVGYSSSTEVKIFKYFIYCVIVHVNKINLDKKKLQIWCKVRCFVRLVCYFIN